MRVMVVEARPLVVDRLIALSAEYPDFQVAREVTSGVAALDMASWFRPHIVLIDEQLPDASGMQICEHLHQGLEEAALILVADVHTDAVRLLAAEAGACGLVSRTTPDDELILALLRAAEGEFLMPRSVTLRLFRVERALREQALRRYVALRFGLIGSSIRGWWQRRWKP